MTPEKRLDQLEPIMAEMIQKQDELGSQNQALAKMYFDLTVKQIEIRKDVGKIREQLITVKNEQTIQSDRLARIEDIVTAIYQAVQKPSGN
jgi:uncharacterized protein YydD (DUF2326 family)